jgi:hypothetical protein
MRNDHGKQKLAAFPVETVQARLVLQRQIYYDAVKVQRRNWDRNATTQKLHRVGIPTLKSKLYLGRAGLCVTGRLCLVTGRACRR